MISIGPLHRTSNQGLQQEGFTLAERSSVSLQVSRDRDSCKTGQHVRLWPSIPRCYIFCLMFANVTKTRRFGFG